jgi:outer membrane lipoprotein-sorting protein
MRFLRTAPTGRLLAVIATVVVVIAAGTAIAMAAAGGGPVPARKPLAQALHQALAAPAVKGISADISFSDNLIDSSDFTGQTADPLLQGATGRLWIADDGRMRLELQSDDGDAQVVVDHSSFWVSDPTQNVVYEGTLPAHHDAGATSETTHGIPSVGRIQSLLTRLMQRVDVSGAQPTDVAGRAAYRVSIAPKHDGGLLGSAQIAWDAVNGVPLQLGIYARGNPTPVIDLKATHISYGAVPASDLNVSPPAGAKVIKLASPRTPVASGAGTAHGSKVQGTAAVAAKVPFTLDAPSSLVGLPRRATRLISAGGAPAAMMAYGEHLGGMIVIESKSSGATDKSGAGSGSMTGGLSLPTVTIGNVTGTELSTPLGTVIHFTRGGVDFTVLGSVPATAAEMAARGL